MGLEPLTGEVEDVEVNYDGESVGTTTIRDGDEINISSDGESGSEEVTVSHNIIANEGTSTVEFPMDGVATFQSADVDNSGDWLEAEIAGVNVLNLDSGDQVSVSKGDTAEYTVHTTYTSARRLVFDVTYEIPDEIGVDELIIE